jgi:hypothetical protein
VFVRHSRTSFTATSNTFSNLIFLFFVSITNYPCRGLDKSLRPQELEAPRILRQSALEGGKVVSLTHRPPLPSKGDPWYLFLLGAESIPPPLPHKEKFLVHISVTGYVDSSQSHMTAERIKLMNNLRLHRATNPRPSGL